MSAALSTAQAMTQFLPRYRDQYALSPQQAKVVNLLCACRTEVLGGRRVHCDHCDYHAEQYHSCRNRHCPQCQKTASDAWLAQRREDLLSVPYFHLVFTLPHTLNGWAQLHPRELYRLLFKVVWQTLRTFGRDPKRLNGELGMTSVLHTWGQNLSQHIHLHCLVPGGAWQAQTQQWQPARSTYLFPVKALSRYFRGAMVAALRRAADSGCLHRLADPVETACVLDALMATPWVVFAKSTCQHTDSVLTYLSRYTHRIAISDYRLRAIDVDTVAFDVKDYREEGTHKTLRLAGEEYLRRFLLHVLPHGFMRVRHYGFLANCHRRKKLAEIRAALQAGEETDTTHVLELNTQNGVSIMSPTIVCPKCHFGRLKMLGEIMPQKRRRRFA